MATVLGFLKNNWMVIAAALVIVAIVLIFMSMRKEKYYDYEMTGCSTCSTGDAGVFDYEEMYQMPDDYYSDAENDEIYEEDEIYEDDTFAGDDDNADAEDSPVLYEDMYADGYDARDEAIAVTEDIMATGFDEEEGMDADMVFAEEVMDGGIDGEEDVDMLEIDELDAEEDDFSEL
jgi:hypothetical protein